MRRQAGVTLLEVLIAVTLLSVLSVGMMLSLRIGISALSRTDSRLMDNRRVAGAQRILQQELEALIPVVAPCGGGGGHAVIFAGLPNSLTMVTGFSLQEAWRGRPQIIQLFTIPDEEGGVRLVVNETPYTGPEAAGRLCTGFDNGASRFPQPSAGPTTFVLADHLQTVDFQYLNVPEKIEEPGFWTPAWQSSSWPYGIRVRITPRAPSPARLQPISVTAPIFLNRDPGVTYVGE